MSTRSYDYELTLSGGTIENYHKDNVIVGASSATQGRIVNVDSANSKIKVKVANSDTYFTSGESVSIQSVVLSSGNTNLRFGDLSFDHRDYSSTTSGQSRTIDSIALQGFSSFKNAVEQSPLVRLVTVYYPGEYYPPNEAGNPTNDGAGHAWPIGFPYRFAEVRGDFFSDIEYRAHHHGNEYLVYPLQLTGIDIASDGRVNQVTMTLSNFDNLVAGLVENPYIAGNNTSNSTYATVNGEIVSNIDPRTVPTHADYDQNIVDTVYASTVNSAFTYDQTIAQGGTWVNSKQDSRDLLGGVVEIKTTFAGALDYWPEYSAVREARGNVVQLYSSLPYRVGDNVIVAGSSTKHSTVQEVRGNFLQLKDNIKTIVGDKLYIVNPDRDPHAYVEDKFKINQLTSLNEGFAQFNLSNWLEHFKHMLPKRKFYKNTCQWTYKGEECQYPEDGTGSIIGYPAGKSKSANGFFDVNNASTLVKSEDVCSKNYEACSLRNNQIHFGGFIATGRNLPK